MARTTRWHWSNPHVINAIATAFLVGVGIWGCTETRRSLSLSERGWIAPLYAKLDAPLEEGKPIRFIVAFQNTGKQPVFDVAFQSDNSTIIAPPADKWADLIVSPNNTCDHVVSKRGELAIYPSTTAGGITGHAFDSATGLTQINATKSLIDGVDYYVVQGCAGYTTFDEPHRTAFCFVLQTVPNIFWTNLRFAYCPGDHENFGD